MKKACTILFATILFVVSCSKKSGDDPPTPPVDNGPLGGTYSFTAANANTHDTASGSLPGTVSMAEYITITTNLKGTITITASSISSSGLQYDFTTTGTRKDKNTTTGSETSTPIGPTSGSRGSATANYSSVYTLSAATNTLTVTDAQYLFNPAFLLLPVSKLYKYSLTGSTLKITVEYYDPGTRYRGVYEATFQKQ